MRIVVLIVCVALVGCGSDQPARTAASSTSVAPATVAPATGDTEAGGTVAAAIVNTWVAPPVDITTLPIGTAKVSTSGPAVGGLFACSPGNAGGGGAFAVGPWIDEAAGTWDASAKIAVRGDVEWPMAEYAEAVEGTQRIITSNGLPTHTHTGTFPIAADDPAFSYDRNPN